MTPASLLPLPGELTWFSAVKITLILAALFFAAGAVLRLLFGRESKTNRALSACLSILMLYLAAIPIYLLFPESRADLSSLPFITVDETRFILWNLTSLSDPVLYGALLRLAILAFLVNLLDTALPRGETFLSWYFYRLVTVLVSLVLYRLACGLAEEYLPQLFNQWAKPVILIFWSTILFSGILNLLLSVALTVMNPIIGALYAFFFSNFLGRQCSKSALTSLILMGLITILNRIGFDQFAFSDFSVAGYGPACVVLIGTLYLFGRFL